MPPNAENMSVSEENRENISLNTKEIIAKEKEERKEEIESRQVGSGRTPGTC